MSEPAAAPEPGAPASPAAVVSTAAAKAGLVWVGPAGGTARPVWHVWNDGAVVLVVGGEEQPDPVPAGASHVEVRVPSKDTRARLVTLTARVEEVPPGTEPWERLTFALKAGRLNATGADTLLDRWAATSRVLRLVPEGDVLEGPGGYDDSSGATTPLPTPATTDTWRPFHAGGRRRRRRRPR